MKTITRNESVEYIFLSTFNNRNMKEGMKSPISASIKFIFNIPSYNMFSLSSTYFKQYLLIYYVLKII
jgi:hypothetical protein